MARVNVVQKSRKEQRCGGCGRTIPVGSKYFYVDFYSGRHAVRCAECGFKPYETTENPYLQELYQLKYDYNKRLEALDADTDDIDILSELSSDLENLRDEVQERFDNIPEQLQDGEAGSLLQERIDSIDGVLSDIDSEEYQTFEDWRDYEGYGENDFDSWCEENGYADDEETDMEDHRDEFDDEAKEKYNDYVSDLASTISNYLDDIAE